MSSMKRRSLAFRECANWLIAEGAQFFQVALAELRLPAAPVISYLDLLSGEEALH